MNRLCHVLLNRASGRRDFRSTTVLATFLAAILPLRAAPIDFPELKATDFAPLTAIPWDQTKGSDEVIETPQVLAAIYREPNLAMRYRLLEEYLRLLSVAEMEGAFKLCLPHEGTDTPDDLVAFFIAVLADRDPKACWEWVKRLFEVAGLESHALDLDSWTHEVRVHNLEAIRASPFWIDRDALKGFPLLINRSNLPADERVKIMRGFAERWFSAFAEWPGYSAKGDSAKGYLTRADQNGNGPLIDTFRRRLPSKEGEAEKAESAVKEFHVSNASPAVRDLCFEIFIRRLLVANPASAPDLAQSARQRWLQKEASAERERSSAPSEEFLLLWARTDLPGMVRWVENLPGVVRWEEREAEPYEKLEIRAKGVLMSMVDENTRGRWLSSEDQGSAEKKQEWLAVLLQSCARWDLRAAIEEASKAKLSQAAYGGLANQAVYAWQYNDWRRARYAFQVLSTFDFSKLSPAVHKAVLDDPYSFMEQWDSMDVAAAAKFGLAYLLRTNYAPRKRLAAFFSGSDIYGGEDGMIDRTFCAMRLWAVVRPGEMKEWIKTVPDDELRKALFWLVEHPFGKEQATGRK